MKSVSRLSAESSNEELKYDVILISLGARYYAYCSNIARTYLVDPNKTQQAQYEALLEAQEAAVQALQPGKPMSDAYAAAVKTLQVIISGLGYCQALLQVVLKSVTKDQSL